MKAIGTRKNGIVRLRKIKAREYKIRGGVGTSESVKQEECVKGSEKKNTQGMRTQRERRRIYRGIKKISYERNKKGGGRYGKVTYR